MSFIISFVFLGFILYMQYAYNRLVKKHRLLREECSERLTRYESIDTKEFPIVKIQNVKRMSIAEYAEYERYRGLIDYKSFCDMMPDIRKCTRKDIRELGPNQIEVTTELYAVKFS